MNTVQIEFQAKDVGLLSMIKSADESMIRIERSGKSASEQVDRLESRMRTLAALAKQVGIDLKPLELQAIRERGLENIERYIQGLDRMISKQSLLATQTKKATDELTRQASTPAASSPKFRSAGFALEGSIPITKGAGNIQFDRSVEFARERRFQQQREQVTQLTGAEFQKIWHSCPLKRKDSRFIWVRNLAHPRKVCPTFNIYCSIMVAVKHKPAMHAAMLALAKRLLNAATTIAAILRSELSRYFHDTTASTLSLARVY